VEWKVKLQQVKTKSNLYQNERKRNTQGNPHDVGILRRRNQS
jgi:hypothetical protein